MRVSDNQQDESEVRIEETRAEIQEALDRVHELVSEAKRNLGNVTLFSGESPERD